MVSVNFTLLNLHVLSHAQMENELQILKEKENQRREKKRERVKKWRQENRGIFGTEAEGK